MCDHTFMLHESCTLCINCGLQKGYQMVNGFEKRSWITKPYSKRSRFKRVFKNLRGWQVVDYEVCKTVSNLKTVPEILNKLREINKKNHIPKIASIWRNLGRVVLPITDQEVKNAMQLYDKVKEHCSLIYLVPAICKALGRLDLLQFLRVPSQQMQKQYAHLSEILVKD